MQMPNGAYSYNWTQQPSKEEKEFNRLKAMKSILQNINKNFHNMDNFVVCGKLDAIISILDSFEK
jgi:hypothetical protein